VLVSNNVEGDPAMTPRDIPLKTKHMEEFEEK
jgi:hypothetical protein